MTAGRMGKRKPSCPTFVRRLLRTDRSQCIQDKLSKDNVGVNEEKRLMELTQASAAGAQIARATQGVFKRSYRTKKDREKGKKLGGGKKFDTSTTPSAQHDRKDENNQKPHKNDDEINCKTK